VNPELAVRILEVGSSSDEEWLHGFWAGLLISSTSPDGQNTDNLELVELFSQLTPISIRILTVICTRATKTLSETGDVTAKPLACDINELVATVGSRGPQIERELDGLAGLQLIERKSASASALQANKVAYVMPTRLGLELFALCNGHQGSLREFYFEDSADAAGTGTY
jgi:hypothetical protein